MNITETAKLCSIIAGVIPQQRFEPDTPTYWHPALTEIRYADAIAAFKRLVGREPYTGVHDICTAVEAIRRERVKSFEGADGVVPNIDPDNPRAYAEERRAIIQAVADDTFDIEAYRRGGITLSGAAPHRPALTSAPEVQGPVGIVEALAAELIPRSTLKADERERSEIEQRAAERARAEQLAALQKRIDDGDTQEEAS